MKLIATAFALCALCAPAFAQPKAPPVTVDDRFGDAIAAKSCPCATCDCASGIPCDCGPACKCPSCPTNIATAKGDPRPVRPQVLHVSPDGTVNELHTDGWYRAVPGAAKRTPPTAPSLATYAVPSCVGGSCANGTCAGGTCGAPSFAQPLPSFQQFAPTYQFAPFQSFGGCANGTCVAPGR